MIAVIAPLHEDIQNQETVKVAAIRPMPKLEPLRPRNHIETYTLPGGTITDRVSYAMTLYMSDWQVAPKVVYFDETQLLRLNYDFWQACLARGLDLRPIPLPADTILVWGQPYA